MSLGRFSSAGLSQSNPAETLGSKLSTEAKVLKSLCSFAKALNGVVIRMLEISGPASKALGVRVLVLTVIVALVQGCFMFPVEPVRVSTLIHTFAVGSDGHYGDVTYPDNLNGARNEVFVESLVENGAERFFDCGDLIDEWGYHAAYLSIKTIYDSAGIPFNVVAGNHDNAPIFLASFGYSSLHYNITHEFMVWIILHSVATSPPSEINATQLTYLEDALDYYSDRLVFILMHVSNVKLAYPEMEAAGPNFQAIIESHANHIGGVFFGHVHNYNVMTYEVNSIRYSYAGTFGNGYPVGGVTPHPYRYLLVKVFDDWGVVIDCISPDDNTRLSASTAES